MKAVVVALVAFGCGTRAPARHASVPDERGVNVIVLDRQGNRAETSSYGWYAQQGAGEHSERVYATIDEYGRVGITHDMPRGAVAVFAFSADERWFGVAELNVQDDRMHDLTLRLDRPISTLRARVLDAEGAALTASIRLELLGDSTLGERAFLGLQPNESGLEGEVLFQTLAPAQRHRLSMSVWKRGETSKPELESRVIQSVEFVPAEQPALELRAPVLPVVKCTLVDAQSRPLAIEQLGLRFGNHDQQAHEGSCLELGVTGTDTTVESGPDVVRFLWPEGATRVDVYLRQLHDWEAEHSMHGALQLSDASQPCAIVAVPNLQQF